MAASNLREQPSRMRGLLGKVSGWWSRNVAGGGPDFTASPVPDVAAPPAESTEAALAEEFERRADQADTLQDIAEAVEHSVEKPGEAGQAIDRFAVGQAGGTPGLLIHDLQHDPHQIAGDVGWGIFGVLRSVVLRVLAHVIAAPEHNGQPGKRP